jgi:hypothetical protein
MACGNTTSTGDDLQAQPLLNRISVRQSSHVRLVLADPRPLGPKSIGSATTPAVVQMTNIMMNRLTCLLK